MLQMQEVWVRSLVGELRYPTCRVAQKIKKKKKIENNEINNDTYNGHVPFISFPGRICHEKEILAYWPSCIAALGLYFSLKCSLSARSWIPSKTQTLKRPFQQPSPLWSPIREPKHTQLFINKLPTNLSADLRSI